MSLALAFIAKAVYNFSNTKILIDYIKNNATLRRTCGWEGKKDCSQSTYDSKEVYEISKRLNHVPIIDSNKRKGEKKEFDPAKKVRYNQRSSAERIMSNLKDNYGGNTVRVKGYKKVMAHLMFGIIAMTAEQLFRMVT